MLFFVFFCFRLKVVKLDEAVVNQIVRLYRTDTDASFVRTGCKVL